MKIKDRIKSYSFWVSFASAVILIFKLLGQKFGFTVNENLISDIFTSLCGILVLMGIIVVPKTEESSNQIKKSSIISNLFDDEDSNIKTTINDSINDDINQNLNLNNYLTDNVLNYDNINTDTNCSTIIDNNNNNIIDNDIENLETENTNNKLNNDYENPQCDEQAEQIACDNMQCDNQPEQVGSDNFNTQNVELTTPINYNIQQFSDDLSTMIKDEQIRFQDILAEYKKKVIDEINNH